MDPHLAMKILVTGSAGLVGSQVVKDLIEQNYEVYSCYHKSKPEHGIAVNLDLVNQEEIKTAIHKTKPAAIIHLAAITNVDQCEIQPDLAKKINSRATEILARQAARQNSFFVYVSTDYIFDGKNKMRKESDMPNPLSSYGKSKLEGELVLNNMAFAYAIARTSTPFGFHNLKKSFPIWIKENLEAKKDIPVSVDQFTSPTFVPHLSKMLIEIATKQLTGIIHTAGASRISRYSLAEMISEKLNLDKKFLRPVSMSEMTWKAQRPKDSSLDVSLATELLDQKPQTIEKSLDEMFSNL